MLIVIIITVVLSRGTTTGGFYPALVERSRADREDETRQVASKMQCTERKHLCFSVIHRQTRRNALWFTPLLLQLHTVRRKKTPKFFIITSTILD